MLALAPVIAIWVPIVFFGWEIDGPLEALPLLPVGVLASVATLHLFNGLELALRADRAGDARPEHGRAARARRRPARRRAPASSPPPTTSAAGIERDLHDGAQQRLVALTLTLGLAEGQLESDPDTARKLVA